MLIHLHKRTTLILACLFLILNNLSAQPNEDCLMCHEDPGLTTVRHGKTVSLYENGKVLNKSVHKDVTCASCHTDAAVEEFPHPEILKPVNCGSCHKNAKKYFDAGIHGQALKLNESLIVTRYVFV